MLHLICHQGNANEGTENALPSYQNGQKGRVESWKAPGSGCFLEKSCHLSPRLPAPDTSYKKEKSTSILF